MARLEHWTNPNRGERVRVLVEDEEVVEISYELLSSMLTRLGMVRDNIERIIVGEVPDAWS